MTNRKNYEDETINKRMLIMISVIYLLWLFFTIVIVLEGEIEAAIVFIVVFIIMLICLPLAYLKKRKFCKNRNLIIETGTKITGKIIDSEVHYDISRDRGRLASVHMKVKFIIEYTYNDKVEKFTTPDVIFSSSELISDEVAVYISNDGIYVDDYKLKKEPKYFLGMK